MIDSTVGALAELVGGTVIGDAGRTIRAVKDLRDAGPSDIGFVRDRTYVPIAVDSRAGALVVSEELEIEQPQILVGDAAVAFARIASHFHPPAIATEHRIHPTASIDPAATLSEPVEVGPNVVVGAGVRVGAGTILHSGVFVGDDVTIGRACVLYPNVVLYADIELGDRVVLHAGCVVGSDGFGYTRNESRWIKVPQVGTVCIEDDVEIGANSAIDRATLGTTRVGAGTKIDNLVHIGHNCEIGRDNVVAGCCAFSGSTLIGDRVSIAGHVVFAGHLSVVDDVRIGGNSVVYRSIKKPGDYMGYPLIPKTQWGRTLQVLSRIAELQPQLRRLLPRKRKD